MENKIKEIEEKLLRKEQECEKIKEDNATLFDKAIEARKECTDLKEQLFLLKIDYAELEKRYNDSFEQFNQLKAENEDLKKSILQVCPNCGEEYLNYKGVELYYENNDLKQTLAEIKEIAEFSFRPYKVCGEYNNCCELVAKILSKISEVENEN